MLGISERQRARDDDRSDGTQPGDDLSRVVEPSHMGIAAGKRAVWWRVRRTFVDRHEQLGHRGVELPIYQIRATDHGQMRTQPLAWAEP